MLALFKSLCVPILNRVLPLHRQVNLVARFLPASQWYACAEKISGIHGTLANTIGKNGRLTRALMFDHWLKILTLAGPFTIPWRNADDSALRGIEPGRGTLFCWTHLPLVEFALSTLVELGHRPLIVCDPGMMVEGNKSVAPGLPDRLDAVPARASSLRRVLAELRSGQPVAWLTDPVLGGEISDQTLRLVALAGARLVFVWGERDADGTIAVRFVDPPFPDCENPAAIEANLQVLRFERRRILTALGASDGTGAPPAAKPRKVRPRLREQFSHR